MKKHVSAATKDLLGPSSPWSHLGERPSMNEHSNQAGRPLPGPSAGSYAISPRLPFT